MIDNGITTFIEMGPGSVLTGLLKRIDRSVTGIAIDAPGSFASLPIPN
jgi:[acyl-carrier-protein] S-malonyltransferase